jgi:hypothetical protein
MLHLLEIILSWLFPVYYEADAFMKHGKTATYYAQSMEDIENIVEDLMAGDTGEIDYIVIDKYINCRPDLEVKVNRFHKTYTSKT